MFRSFAIGAAIVGSIGVIAAWLYGDFWGWVMSDYRTFFAASRIAVPHLYDGPNFTFIYPPTAIFLTRLLSLASFWPGFLILSTLSGALFLWAVRPRSVAALSLLSVPALQGLLWGQISLLLTAVLLWALTLSPLRKGLALGVLLAIKPQLFIAAPLVFAMQRDRLAVAGTVAGALLSVAASIALFGVESWVNWLTALNQFPDFLERSKAFVGLVTPTGIAVRTGLPLLPFTLSGLALAAWIVSRSREVSNPGQLAAVIGGASLMAAPYAMTHDAIVLIPAAVMALLAARNAGPSILLYCAPFVPGTLPLFLVTELRRRARSGNDDLASAAPALPVR